MSVRFWLNGVARFHFGMKISRREGSLKEKVDTEGKASESTTHNQELILCNVSHTRTQIWYRGLLLPSTVSPPYICNASRVTY
jgi:adenine deaminase